MLVVQADCKSNPLVFVWGGMYFAVVYFAVVCFAVWG